MPSITTWTRLHPHLQTSDIEQGLQAQIHDPLWMLARQWQFGEFQGEDVGSPITARLTTDVSQLSRYYPGAIANAVNPSLAAHSYDNTLPLETLVERDRPQLHRRFAAEAGLHFLRLLEQHQVGTYRAAYRRAYALQPPTEQEQQTLDAESLRFLELMARRVPDGVRLYEDLRTGLNPDNQQRNLPQVPEIAESDRQAVINAAIAWFTWYDAQTFPDVPEKPWISERMEYEFAVSAQTNTGEVVLVAPEYTEGHLDWASFSVCSGVNLGATGSPTSTTQTMIPAPVSFRGMPTSRWWEFEDAQIDFNAIQAEPNDLARLLLLEFALLYSNDWFVIPVDLPVGSLCQVTGLEVIDTFGDRTSIPATSSLDSQSPWRMFSLSPDRRASTSAAAPNLFFLPPALGTSLQSQPIEDVLFLRDEMANLAWAVERIVESPIGQPLNRLEAYLAQQKQAEQEQGAIAANNLVTYQLATTVPDHWIPLVPTPLETGSIYLQRGQLLQPNGETSAAYPQSRLLQPVPDQPLHLHEAEVPRAGARVTRSYQYTRWLNGSSHLWISQQKQPGRGEGSSNLQFDTIR